MDSGTGNPKPGDSGRERPNQKIQEPGNQDLFRGGETTRLRDQETQTRDRENPIGGTGRFREHPNLEILGQGKPTLGDG